MPIQFSTLEKPIPSLWFQHMVLKASTLVYRVLNYPFQLYGSYAWISGPVL